MKMKKESDISQIQELDYVGSETCSAALTGRLMARVARRPGRWRARMQARQIVQHEAPTLFDEAA